MAVVLLASIASASGVWYAGNMQIGYIYGPFPNYNSCVNWSTNFGMKTHQIYSCMEF